MATRCPYCFVDLFLAPRFAFLCMNPGCKEEKDPYASGHVGEDVRSRPVKHVGLSPTGQMPTQVNCDACNAVTTTQVCPRCHYRLPDQWRTLSTTCIALAGARASGKSLYIAVLKRQLELLVTRLGGAMRYFDETTRLMYEESYLAPLYEQRNMLAATAARRAADSPTRHPMIFRLGTFAGRPQVLVIRDTAGEDLENPTLDPMPFSYFFEADAMLFLFDPMNVPAIRRQLTGLVPFQQQMSANPLVVLDNVIRIMQTTSKSARVTNRLALVLAKFDALHLLPDLPGSQWAAALGNPGAALNRDPSLDVTYDEDDGELLHAEIESVLHRLNGGDVLNAVREVFPNWRLFAASALGAPPASLDTANPRGIAPFRVLDPVKWTMASVGALQVTTTRPAA